jgi:hypothetical protein
LRGAVSPALLRAIHQEAISELEPISKGLAGKIKFGRGPFRSPDGFGELSVGEQIVPRAVFIIST